MSCGFGRIDYVALDGGTMYRKFQLLSEVAGELRVEARYLYGLGDKLVRRGLVTEKEFQGMSLEEATKLMLRVPGVKEKVKEEIVALLHKRGKAGSPKSDFHPAQWPFVNQCIEEGKVILANDRLYLAAISVKQHLRDIGSAASGLFRGQTSEEIKAGHPECVGMDWWAFAKRITEDRHLEDLWAPEFAGWRGSCNELVKRLREKNREMGLESYWYFKIREFLSAWGGRNLGLSWMMARQLDDFIVRERSVAPACSVVLFSRFVNDDGVQSDASESMGAASFKQLNGLVCERIQAMAMKFAEGTELPSMSAIDLRRSREKAVLFRRSRDGATLLVVATPQKKLDWDAVQAAEKIVV